MVGTTIANIAIATRTSINVKPVAACRRLASRHWLLATGSLKRDTVFCLLFSVICRLSSVFCLLLSAVCHLTSVTGLLAPETGIGNLKRIKIQNENT